jgi:nucleotide-binding universal stress UspA family protein
MFKNILVAVDGSATSQRGLKTAIALATEQNAQLHILHVVDERNSVIYPEMGYYLDELLASLRSGGKAILEKAQRQAAQVGRVRTRLVESASQPVAEVIVAESRRARADLVVLGTHGRRGLGRLVMGSDAEGVVRSSTVPVLLVRDPSARPAKRSARKSAPARAK